MNPKSSDYKRDIKLVDNTLLDLIRGRLLMLVAVCVLILAVLYFVAKKILSFGKSLDYSFLKDTAVDVVVEYLEKYDSYFWWAIVIIIALFVLSFINNLVRQSLDSFSKTTIPMPIARGFITRLSPMALEVLSWVWNERREPLKVNDIKQLSRELKQGRFSRIEEAKEQERLLDKGIYGSSYIDENQAPTSTTLAQSEPRLDEPVLSQNDTVSVEKDRIIIKNDAKS